MRRTAYGLGVDVPSGWSAAILRRPVGAADPFAGGSPGTEPDHPAGPGR